MVNLLTHRFLYSLLNGFSYSFIARDYGFSTSKCTWSTEKRPGSGRRRKTAPRDDSLILRRVVRKTRRVAAHRIRLDLELENVWAETQRDFRTSRSIRESSLNCRFSPSTRLTTFMLHVDLNF